MVGENVGVGSEGVDVGTAGPLFKDLHGAWPAWHSPGHPCNKYFGSLEVKIKMVKTIMHK